MLQSFTDQMNRSVEINFPPQRIISLVPSQTELLYDLGLWDEVVGQTLFCIHPDQAHREKPRVGGTKKLNIEAIAALKPDLIIGNKEENERSQIEALALLYPVWMSDITTVDEALDMIRKVGGLVNRKVEAQKMANEIEIGFSQIKPARPIRVAYLIWRDPWMAAGHNTFISDVLHRLGLENAFVNETSRYPEISKLQLQTAHVDKIMLSSEPYPFKEKHIEELHAICPHAQIELVDGEMYSWYGSRMRKWCVGV